MYWIQEGKLSPEIAGLYLDQIVRFNPLKYNSDIDILNCPGVDNYRLDSSFYLHCLMN